VKIIKKQLIASFFFLFVSTQLAAFTNATSYFSANNYVMYHKPPIDTRLLLGGFFEMGSTRSSKNLTGSKVGLFQQYNDSEYIGRTSFIPQSIHGFRKRNFFLKSNCIKLII
jgi:hypothetical protein